MDEWNTGKVKGICGSAIIDAVAELFRAEIIDSRGKFRKDLEVEACPGRGKGLGVCHCLGGGNVHWTGHPDYTTGCEANPIGKGGIVHGGAHVVEAQWLAEPR